MAKDMKWFYPFLWLLVAVMFIGLLSMQFSRYYEYSRDLKNLSAELEREQKIAVDLQNQKAFYESDMYIEQLARDRLGYIKSDEIIFINIAEN